MRTVKTMMQVHDTVLRFFFVSKGINSLLARGVYDSAFPLHDVSITDSGESEFIMIISFFYICPMEISVDKLGLLSSFKRNTLPNPIYECHYAWDMTL